MKTWRERIAEAVRRGGFTEEDRYLACASSTCAVGEVSQRYGWESMDGVYVRTRLSGEPEASSTCPNWTMGVRHSSAFTGCVITGDVRGAERLLDEIEDRALALKREQT
jgi:hypothetical protein